MLNATRKQLDALTHGGRKRGTEQPGEPCTACTTLRDRHTKLGLDGADGLLCDRHFAERVAEALKKPCCEPHARGYTCFHRPHPEVNSMGERCTCILHTVHPCACTACKQAMVVWRARHSDDSSASGKP